MLLKDYIQSNNLGDVIEYYRSLVKDRANYTINDFSEKEKELINNDILTIVKIHPQCKKIHITGSFLTGMHRMENDEKIFLTIVKKIFGQIKYSDRDYIIEPHIDLNMNGIDAIKEEFLAKNKRKILVYNCGKFLLKKKIGFRE